MGTTTKCWIQTVSGRVVNPLLMDINDVHMGDIAHALSQIVRFTGHCSQPYTVAQHCVHVSYLCNPVFAKEALLHDAAEAYLNDLNTPVKKELSRYRDIEDDLLRVIYRKYGLAEGLPKDVKDADETMFRLECLRFFPNGSPLWLAYKLKAEEYTKSSVKIERVLDHQEARLAFITRYEELFESEFLPPPTIVMLNG